MRPLDVGESVFLELRILPEARGNRRLTAQTGEDVTQIRLGVQGLVRIREGSAPGNVGLVYRELTE